MKIERIVFTHVRIPLCEPFRISSGSVSEKDAIIVELHSQGAVAYGESSPMSGTFYSNDTPDSVWTQLVEKIGPAMLKRDITSPAEVNDLPGVTTCSGFARAGVETAVWDLKANLSGRSITTELGGSRDEIESGLAVGIYASTKILLEKIREYLAEGYKRVKIKIQKGWDVEPLSAIRESFGDDVSLMVDANCAYGRQDIDYLKRLDEFGLMMIEQPLGGDDLVGHARLQESIETPVCLDESAESPSSVREAINLGSCRIVNIKLQRVGGFTNAKLIYELCKSAGLGIWVGTMPELGIGGIHALMFSSLPGCNYPTDVESSARWFADDIVVPRLTVRNGIFSLSDYESYKVDWNVVERYKVRESSLSGN